METLLDCNICRNSFNYEERQPLILACGHTFCKSCLVILRSSTRIIRCPNDRKIESREAHKLPVNYALLQIIDYHRTGINTKEKCHVHKFPISMICRTCHMNCCSKCIRKHLNHDIFDLENPVILNDIENSLKKYENRLRDYRERCRINKSRISFELGKLNNEYGKMQKEIHSYYDTVIHTIELKKQETLEHLDYYYKDKINILSKQDTDTDEQCRYYEVHLNDLLSCMKEFYDQVYVDRAVTCTNLLRELDLVHFCEVPDINHHHLRMSVNATKWPPASYGIISITEQSPLEILDKEINESLDSLHSNVAKYEQSNIEEKLYLETLSTSLYIMLTSGDRIKSIFHIIESLSKDVLGQGFFQLRPKTQMKIASKAGIDQTEKQDYSLDGEGLRNRVSYATGLVSALGYIKKRAWKEALQVLHYLLITHSNSQIAEQLMNVLFLIMCSEGYSMLKSLRTGDAYAILWMVLRYMQNHILPSNIVYRQVLKTIKFIQKNVHSFAVWETCSGIIEQLAEMVESLLKPCDYAVGIDLPGPVQDLMETMKGGDYTWWKNDKLNRDFLVTFQQFKEGSASWWLALRLIVDQDEVLSDQEQEKLEMGRGLSNH